MRVLLIDPPCAAAPLERRLGNYTPPLNLLYLAPRPEAETLNIATYSQNMPEVYSLCRGLKASLPGAETKVLANHAAASFAFLAGNR